MDLKALSIFVDVVRLGNFAAVAHQRNVDPATISRTIAALEEELNLRLFQRTTRRIEPTEAGRVYFERIEPLVEELSRAQLAATDTGANPRGLLRISSPVSFAHLNILPLLPEFAARYPELTFDVILNDADLDLIATHIDVAIRVGPPPDSRLISTRLAVMETRVVATPEYVARNGAPACPADLAERDCLIHGYRGFDANQWRFTDRTTGKTKTVTVRERLRTSNAMALKLCTEEGMGIALLARWMVGRELRTGTLVDLFPNDDVTSALATPAAWAIFASRAYVPGKVRVFVDFLKEKFRDGPPWDQEPDAR